MASLLLLLRTLSHTSPYCVLLFPSRQPPLLTTRSRHHILFITSFHPHLKPSIDQHSSPSTHYHHILHPSSASDKTQANPTTVVTFSVRLFPRSCVQTRRQVINQGSASKIYLHPRSPTAAFFVCRSRKLPKSSRFHLAPPLHFLPHYESLVRVKQWVL